MAESVREDLSELMDKAPGWLVTLVVFVFAVSGVFGFLLRRVALWVSVWLGVAQAAVSLFVVYLFYRLVIAVERISEDS